MNYTYRKYKDFLDVNVPLLNSGTGVRPATAADFVPAVAANRPGGVVSGTLRDGTPFSSTLYRLAPGLVYSGGRQLRNNSGYDQNYNGVDINFQKRLSNHWMVRGNFGWQDWKQSVDAGGCMGVDPSNQRLANFSASCRDSEIVAPRSAGSGNKGNIFLNSAWQFNIGGLYQLPYGFNVGANVYGREGYPQTNTISVNPGDGLGRACWSPTTSTASAWTTSSRPISDSRRS